VFKKTKLVLIHCYEKIFRSLCFNLGLQISGLPSPVTLGDEVTITCSYDLSLTSIEWLYNGITVMSTTDSQLNLTFSPVNETVNNRQYTCRVYSASGFQDDSIAINVQGKNFLYKFLNEYFQFIGTIFLIFFQLLHLL